MRIDSDAKDEFNRKLFAHSSPVYVQFEGKGVFDVDAAQEKTVGPFVCAGCSTTPTYDYSMTIATAHVATSLFGGDGLWDDRVGIGASVGSVQPK